MESIHTPPHSGSVRSSATAQWSQRGPERAGGGRGGAGRPCLMGTVSVGKMVVTVPTPLTRAPDDGKAVNLMCVCSQ